ncbi:SDR family oxidoreductase [Rhizobium sp. Root708]|uniref:SDR family oxidoreductase n=1 Tax=Rhizobium sp. Root708 TaxID=1736592 RepID=UPI001FCD9B1B|nr:NAD(P)H-binding protein [Rhizobium sp. Root708]
MLTSNAGNAFALQPLQSRWVNQSIGGRSEDSPGATLLIRARPELGDASSPFNASLHRHGGFTMKALVVGGSGRIGSRVCKILKGAGHDVIAASRRTGVDTMTGEGLAASLKGVDVVIDTSDSPSFEESAVFDFFTKSSSNIAREAKSAGVGSLVVLSVVGIDRLPSNGYYSAKLAQEETVKSSGMPFAIVRATQFLEFLDVIASASTQGNVVKVSTAYLQPIAADDVAKFVSAVAMEEPRNQTVDVAGPEAFRASDIMASYLQAKHDPRIVIGDPQATYFGSKLETNSLTPVGTRAALGTITFEAWLGATANT